MERESVERKVFTYLNGKVGMTLGYHVTTPKKLSRYESTGGILPPVRYWPDLATAQRWARRTGRTVIIEVEVTGSSYPLPDHKPARWTNEFVALERMRMLPK